MSMLHVFEPLSFINVPSLKSESAITAPLVIDPGAFILVPIRISHRSITMFDSQLPFSRVHPAVLIRLDSIAVRQVLLPLTLVGVTIREVYRANARKHVIFPITVEARPVSQNQSTLMWQVVLPGTDVLAPIRGVSALAFPMTTVSTEGAFISVAVTVDGDPFALHLVIAPIARVPTAAVAKDDLAFAMLESVLEPASVDVTGQSPQHSFTIHLALAEIALVDVAILKLKAPRSIVVSSDD